MSDLKQKYAEKLHWLEMGIPYLDNPDSNPNAHVFTLAMPWRDVEPILERMKELEAQLEAMKAIVPIMNLSVIALLEEGDKMGAAAIDVCMELVKKALEERNEKT